ncbi:hypothetical protein BDDG_12718 [Blastomyces dermatitidis ATCC 18188]|uniref:Uncharacterized protein n=1 Tax=Ajellomyces dermatitidis (strain ATCC 18188 / CBS 674.68) TaxID=653446 RepID=A0A0J9HGQ1_AJEDA|nr:hypothetical protein BDFG_03015 [Blastomyces dermatitidis ATCC 26199]KMW68289.1 hypothetical protein BDDG_12718 [Blastomyces dermatitidis ATCC 18188]
MVGSLLEKYDAGGSGSIIAEELPRLSKVAVGSLNSCWVKILGLLSNSERNIQSVVMVSCDDKLEGCVEIC